MLGKKSVTINKATLTGVPTPPTQLKVKSKNWN
jgi:hypothetical protein